MKKPIVDHETFAHREENIDTEKNFISLFTAINQMAEKYDMYDFKYYSSFQQ